MSYLRAVLCSVMLSASFANSQISQENHTIQSQNHQDESLHTGDGSPGGSHQDTALDTSHVFKPKVITKRETVTPKCSEVESPSDQVVFLKEINMKKYKFFIQPKPGFRKIMFHMKVDNELNQKDPYTTAKNIVFNSWELMDITNGSWIEVEVEYFKHRIWLKPDKNGLRVIIGKLTRTMESKWQITHSYKGFVIFVDGSSKLLFDCSPLDIVKYEAIATVSNPLLLLGVLGGVFLVLLVVTIWVYVIVIRRHRHNQHPDHPPPVPPLPKALRRGQVKSDPGPNYESFEEDALTRLRQKLDPKTFSCYNATSDAAAKCRRNDAKTNMDANGEFPEPRYQAQTKLSLLEEKQKMWEKNRDGLAPESSYVEMHGIIDSNSDLEH
ncbi:uncharacterized protein LOC121873833 [Homarus americanus]|uniref:Uncharacterized protein n=1 Tax=Homarus americanus TaxID=6706 RepID=A0A8J5JQJ2_HOMAM|nr:uncharacterized protein LOC121873833 [Homarus americanus]KAG7162507.1 hypothetical protein Hamer_G008061 [Homarus americanus]